MSGLFAKFTKGDTIIEVLIAVTVFSIVAVGGVSIMNQGAATAQRSLETTLVRQQIDSQAEALRMMNASYLAAYSPGATYPDNSPEKEWTIISSNTSTSISKYGLDTNTRCSQIIPVDSPTSKKFVINTKTLKVFTPTSINSGTYAKINYNGLEISSVDGIWIQAIKGQEVPATSTTGYIDFHIRACWDSIGQATPMTIGTIVRLYEPR